MVAGLVDEWVDESARATVVEKATRTECKKADYLARKMGQMTAPTTVMTRADTLVDHSENSMEEHLVYAMVDAMVGEMELDLVAP